MALALAAVLLRSWLDPFLGDTLPLVTLFAAVAIAVGFAGLGPALLTTFLGYFLVNWLFIEPRGTIALSQPTNLVGMFAYLLTCGLIIAFCEALRRSRRQAHDARGRAAGQAELLRVTLGSIGDGVIATDRAGNVTFLNGVSETLTGWSAAAAVGRSLQEVFVIVNEHTREPVANPVDKVLLLGQVVGLANHTVLIARDGSERAIDDSAAPIRDAAGTVIGAVLVFRDVTERRAAEMLLRESEAELSEFFQNASIGLHWVNEEGTILRANRAELEMLGYTSEEYIGRNIADFYVDRTEALAVLARLGRGESIDSFETQMRCRDGSTRTVLVNSNVRWHEGRFLHTRCSTFDITDQKRGESLLREHNRLLELIVRGRSEQECLLAVCDAVGRLSDGTRACILLADPTRQHVAQVIGPGFDGSLAQALSGVSIADGEGYWFEAMRSGSPATLLDIAAHPEAPTAWRGLCLRHGIHGCHAVPLPGMDGRPVGVVILCFDRPRALNQWKLRLAEFAINMTGVVLEGERARLALSANERRLAEEARALARLHESGVRLWAVGTVQDGLEEMIGAVMDLMGTTMANFQLMDRERGKLVMAAHRGFNPGYLETFGEVAPGNSSACGRALRSRGRVIIEDVETDAAYAPYLHVARAAGYRSVMATPLMGRDGTPLGVLSTHSAQPGRPDAHALRRLDVFIQLAVDFIERVGAETRLREADRRKDEFLATLAHELRNPLAPLRNALEVMKTAPEARAAVLARETMQRQVSHMVRLIDDLLDVGRITRDKLELRLERVELGAVIRDAVEATRPMVDAAGQSLVVSLPPAPVYLHADPARMAQVFGNLLTNASKYTDPGGRIELAAERRDGKVFVRVKDSGIGIPPHLTEQIFEMFSQVDQSLERTKGGLGIGLTLARRLVLLHHGRISVASEGEAKGSTFEVELPVLEGVPEAKGVAAAPAVTAPPAAEPLRVLVVDDNRDAAMTLAMLLRLEGHDTAVAHDGVEAIGRADEVRPDAIILDLGLPRVSGYEVCRVLRNEPWGRDILMIALTGWGQDGDQRRSSEAGFDVHLVKPADHERLRQILATAPRGGTAPVPREGDRRGAVWKG